MNPTIHSREDLVFWLKLTTIKGLGPAKLLKLISALKEIVNIRNASDQILLQTRVFNEVSISELHKIKSASDEGFDRILDICETENISIFPLIDDRFPQRLRNIPSPPKTLFLKGELSLLKSISVAMVGTRESSEEANSWTSKLAYELAQNGFTIISGGAKGIDTSAHRGALDVTNGKTICVLGSGILRPYPPENVGLFNDILERGGLIISEHLPTFPGSRIALIQRNRITSGLSSALILCASKKMGGAMVQTKIANEQRVQIFIPKMEYNLLPNEGLIQAKLEFGAKEISSAEDVITFLKISASQKDWFA